jgi:hypothetical protein
MELTVNAAIAVLKTNAETLHGTMQVVVRSLHVRPCKNSDQND